MRIKAFTLMELIIVIIILGILAALALPQFGKTKERALGNEAKANLKLIAVAEKIYRMEAGTGYYPLVAPNPQSDIAQINTNLRLSLTETNWDYSVTSAGSPPSSFTATGDRTTGGYPNCIYSINDTTDDPAPVVLANCP